MHIEGNTPANIFDATTGELVRQVPSQDGWSYTAMWSPDGQYLAVSYEKGVVRVWDTQSWDFSQTFASHQGEVWNLDWSPNGERIISGDINGTAFIWDVATGQAVESFTMPWMWSVAWSPDGELVGGANDTMLSLHRAWQSTEELIAYAHECCVWRELTSEEHTQFGLPQR
jgi:WD40 repeat protein